MSISNLTKDEARTAFNYVDGVLLWKPRNKNKNWDTRWIGKPAGRTKSDGRMDISYGNKRIKYHRAVWNWWLGHIPEGMEIDHINGNPSDNRIENLRMCSHQDNMLNRKIQNNNKCGHKNIYFRKDRNVWVVDLRNKGKRFVQDCKTLEEAKELAYNARMKLHGQFANHGQHLAEAA